MIAAARPGDAETKSKQTRKKLTKRIKVLEAFRAPTPVPSG
jgi:hypothetical protein